MVSFEFRIGESKNYTEPEEEVIEMACSPNNTNLTSVNSSNCTTEEDNASIFSSFAGSLCRASGVCRHLHSRRGWKWNPDPNRPEKQDNAKCPEYLYRVIGVRRPAPYFSISAVYRDNIHIY